MWPQELVEMRDFEIAMAEELEEITFFFFFFFELLKNQLKTLKNKFFATSAKINGVYQIFVL